MDRNQTIGFVLILILLGVYFYFFSPKPAQKQTNTQDTTQNDTTQNVVGGQDTTVTADSVVNNSDSINDSIVNVKLTDKFGPFANAAKGKQKFITVENNLMKVKFSTKGGNIYSVDLKKYLTYDKKPAILFKGNKNQFYFKFFVNKKLISTKDLYFEPVTNNENITVNDTTVFKLRAKVSDNTYLEYVYTFSPDNYMLNFNVNFVNLDKYMPKNTTFIELYWNEQVRRLERGEKLERRETKLMYKLYKGSVETLTPTKQQKSKKEDLNVRWISFKQQFFNSTLIAKNYFLSADLSYKSLQNDSTNLYFMSSVIKVPFKVGAKTQIPMYYYFGPNKYSILRKIKVNNEKLELERLIPYGKSLIAWINKFMIIPMFNFFGRFIHNYGIIILIMTLIIKLLLFPLTYQSYASSAKMRIIKPELDKVLAKIPEKDQMKRQQATMDLYKKAGVKPLGGCLPMLLQFPILVAMYRFFPASIELRQKPFLWVHDLSTYDAILTWKTHIPGLGNHLSLFTILMAITMVINTKLSSQNMDSSNSQAKSMKFMMYLFPLLMIIWFNDYSAGLSYYYFLATLIGIIQIYTIRALIDDEKVLAQMRENMKNPKKVKKSKFQQRLEEMQKQQNQIQKGRKKKKKR